MSPTIASMVAAVLNLQAGGDFEIRESVIAAGGGTQQSAAPGSSFVLMSTTGQASTTISTAGSFRLIGGFWSGMPSETLFTDGFEPAP